MATSLRRHARRAGWLWGALVLALVVSMTGRISAPRAHASTTAPSGQDMPVGDLPGWHQVFTDDFATAVPVGSFPGSVYSSKWSVRKDGDKDTSGNGVFYPSKVLSVANGVLNMNLHTENGVHMVASARPTLPGLAVGQGTLYGRYSVRFRADSLSGFKTAWLLWPDSGNWPYGGEIDFPEGDLDGVIKAYMHHMYATSGSDQDWFKSSTPYTGWHTATIEWSPNLVTFILDGNTLGYTTTRVPSTAMHWSLQTETAMDEPAPSNTTNGNIQIDWVAVYTYTGDTIAPPVTPDTAITSGPASLTAATDATFGFDSATAGVSYECKIDYGTYAPCVAPQRYSNFAAGKHTFYVRANNSGLVDASPATQTWTVDTTAPNTTLSSAPSGTVGVANASFSFSASEANSTFACQLDGGSATACTSPQTYSGLADGAHTFSVVATDPAGNPDPTPATASWTVSTALATGRFNDGFESGNLGVWTSVKSGADGSATVQSTTKHDGTYAARFYETANSGSYAYARESFPSAQTDLTVDGYFMVQKEGAVGSSVPIFRLYDASGARQISLYRPNQNGNQIFVQLGSSYIKTSGLLPLNAWGEFTIHAVTAGSQAGLLDIWLNGTQIYHSTTASMGAGILTVQIGNDSQRQAFTLLADTISTHAGAPGAVAPDAAPPAPAPAPTPDTTAPDTTITGGPSGSVTATDATFSFTASEAATFTCQIDGGAPAACVAPQRYSNFAPGAHTFSVVATDAAGNMDPTPATQSWTVVTQVAAPNQIVNGTFDAAGNWFSAWNFKVYPGAQATVTNDSGSARVDVSQASTSAYYVQVKDSKLQLAAGTSYTLTFRAKASTARQIQVVMQQNSSPYTVYTSQKVNLTTGWATYTVTFTAPKADSDAFVGFNLATATGSVWLDDVTLTAN